MAEIARFALGVAVLLAYLAFVAALGWWVATPDDDEAQRPANPPDLW